MNRPLMIFPLYLPVSGPSLICWVEYPFQQHISKDSVMINQYATGITAFFFDSIGVLPRNCFEMGARFDGSMQRGMTGYIYKWEENCFCFLCCFFLQCVSCWSAKQLIPSKIALRGAAVKEKAWIDSKTVYKQLVLLNALIDNVAVITKCVTFLS